MLVACKYLGFFTDSVNALLRLHLTPIKLGLPLGLSFYTFRSVSYTVDVYRGTVRGERSPLKFMCYVTMFPQLIAGPIVRYADIAAELGARRLDRARFSSGVTRFCVGLAKKVMLANAAARAVDILFYKSAKGTVLGSWLGIVFFTFQIYFDFSGYSDMAIGLGRMLGFDFKENFNYPYAATSITDFWRRWHISLSSFFRDYVYIPLGGNRRRQVINLLVVWLLTGLWHGASLNFILWGLYYAALLIIEKFALKNVLRKLPDALQRVYALAFIVVGWGIFYFTDITALGAFFKSAFGVGAALYDFRAWSALTSNVFLLVVLILASTPLPKLAMERLRQNTRLAAVIEPVGSAALLAICFTMLVGSSYSPFLYFKF
jgi:alginate O-acetyltransferase complex protein AlgI